MAATPPIRRPVIFVALVLLYLFSGATALVYEVVFSKHLTKVFGASAPAVSTVLGAFMAGLALGSAIGGRYADRLGRPLRVYAILEVVIGAYALVAPFLFDLVTLAYVALNRDQVAGGSPLVRLVLGAVVVIIPTTLMGMTFPLVARSGIGSDEEIRAKLSRLYGANTLGAALGAFLATFVLMPLWGLSGATWIAAGGNLLIGLLALKLDAVSIDRPASAPPPPDEAPPAPLAPSDGAVARNSLLLAALLIGFTSFAYEVLWTHILAIIAGVSVFAFGLMLTAFLISISLGGWAASVIPASKQRLALVICELGVAGAMVITMAGYEDLPQLFVKYGPVASSFAAREAIRFWVCAQVVLLPTFFIGMAFPLLVSTYASSVGDLGQRVGLVSAFNTFGGIVGSIVAGFVLIPLLHTQRGLQLVVYLTLGIALLLVLSQTRRDDPGRGRVIVVMVAIAALLAVGVSRQRPWDYRRLATATNVYFEEITGRIDKVVYTHEDTGGGLTMVTLNRGVTTLTTNGKFQGNDASEMTAQRRLLHYPMLFAPLEQMKRGLVIGIGTGVTVAAAAVYPFEQIDAVELAPGIAHAARHYFGHVNDRVFEDPRVKVTVNDGRNFLLLSQARYDLVSIELSSIWFAGAANLYNREFYELARKRMADRGIFQQWVQLHHMNLRPFVTILQTLNSVFPHTMLFVAGTQGILVASNHPLRASWPELARRTHDPRLKRGLEGMPLKDWFAFLGGMVLDEEAFGALLEDGARKIGTERKKLLSTDDNLYLEYATPSGNVVRENTIQTLMAWMSNFRRVDRFPVDDAPPWGQRFIAACASATRYQLDRARAEMAATLALVPEEPIVRRAAALLGIEVPPADPAPAAE